MLNEPEAPKLRTVFEFPRQLVYATLALVIALVVMTILIPTEEFNGLTSEDDDTFWKKFVNRLYFATTTVSTIGYGDITPKSTRMRYTIAIVQLFMLFSLQSGLVEYFERRIQYHAAQQEGA